VVDTVSAQHDLHFGLLKTNGKYVCVGAPPQPYQVCCCVTCGPGLARPYVLGPGARWQCLGEPLLSTPASLGSWPATGS
jgi:hypothetical protein